MSNGVFIRVTGVKELDEALKAMTAEMSDKTMQSAAMGASKVLIDRAKSLAPSKGGGLRQSIGVTKGSFNQVRSLQREIGQVKVGPRRGRYKGYAAHLMEFGTKNRYSRSVRGKRTAPSFKGRVTPRPFMEPAFNETKGQVIASYNQFLGKRIVGVMKRKLGSVR